MHDDILRSALTEDALAFPDEATRRLYVRAQEEQWQVERDVGWDALTLHELPQATRRAMVTIYSQVQYGEAAGLGLMSRSIAEAPALWVQLFGATQIMDEARHVEFFSRVLARLGGKADVSPALLTLAREISAATSPEEMLLGTHLIVEDFVQTVFQEGVRLSRLAGRRSIALPGSDAAAALLGNIEHRVCKDESRHIAFGVLYLARRARELDAPRRALLEEKAHRWSVLIADFIGELAESLRVVGISASKLGARVARAQASHFRTIGLDVLRELPDA